MFNPPEFVDVEFAGGLEGGTTELLRFPAVDELVGVAVEELGGGEEDEGSEGVDGTVVLEGGGAD